MTNHTISRVLHQSASEGVPRLVLVVLAASANWLGGVSMPLRDIARYCNLSKIAVSNAIDALIELGELEIVGVGDDEESAAHYRITTPFMAGDHKQADTAVAQERGPLTIDRTPNEFWQTSYDQRHLKELTHAEFADFVIGAPGESGSV